MTRERTIYRHLGRIVPDKTGFNSVKTVSQNPDEQVLSHGKRRVSKLLVQSEAEMKRLTIGALRRIQKLPALVRSFFRQPECP